LEVTLVTCALDELKRNCVRAWLLSNSLYALCTAANTTPTKELAA
jgi:hypothetical protein